MFPSQTDVVYDFSCKLKPAWESKIVVSKDLIVFPNPAQNEVNIAFNDTSLKPESTIYLTDVFGKSIREIQPLLGQLKMTIDISNLVPGIYILNYQNNLGVQKTQKIMVQRN